MLNRSDSFTRFCVLPSVEIMLAAVVTAALLTVASAAEADEVDRLCKNMGEIGAASMTGRQNNVPMSTLMEIVAQEPGPPFVVAMAREIVIEAYEMPHFNDAQTQQLVIADHRNAAELKCYQSPEVRAERY